MAKRVSHFILVVPKDGLVELQGPFRSEEERDVKGKAMGALKDRDGRVFWLDIDRRGMPTTGSFGLGAR
jgi:hypothetical protein